MTSPPNTEVCFVLGSQFYGRAVNTLIQGNRIHDCGREPATNLEHGIYVAVADNTRIVNNVIYKMPTAGSRSIRMRRAPSYSVPRTARSIGRTGSAWGRTSRRTLSTPRRRAATTASRAATLRGLRRQPGRL